MHRFVVGCGWQIALLPNCFFPLEMLAGVVDQALQHGTDDLAALIVGDGPGQVIDQFHQFLVICIDLGMPGHPHIAPR